MNHCLLISWNCIGCRLVKRIDQRSDNDQQRGSSGYLPPSVPLLPRDRPENRLRPGNKTGVRGKRTTHPKSTHPKASFNTPPRTIKSLLNSPRRVILELISVSWTGIYVRILADWVITTYSPVLFGASSFWDNGRPLEFMRHGRPFFHRSFLVQARIGSINIGTLEILSDKSKWLKMSLKWIQNGHQIPIQIETKIYQNSIESDIVVTMLLPLCMSGHQKAFSHVARR